MILRFKSNKILILVKSPIEFLCLFSFWIVITEKVSIRWETKSWKQILLVCSIKKRCSLKWLYGKLPATNECSYRCYGLMYITWKYNSINKSRLWSKNWLRQTYNVAMFLSLPLLNTYSNKEMFWILDA